MRGTLPTGASDLERLTSAAGMGGGSAAGGRVSAFKVEEELGSSSVVASRIASKLVLWDHFRQ